MPEQMKNLDVSVLGVKLWNVLDDELCVITVSFNNEKLYGRLGVNENPISWIQLTWLSLSLCLLFSSSKCSGLSETIYVSRWFRIGRNEPWP